MSEQAVEVTPPRPQAQRGNMFTRKYGPLPGWGWAALAAAGAVGYMWWRNRQATTAAAASTAGTAPTGQAGPGIDYGPQIATLQAEVQQLQGGEGGGTETGGGTTAQYRRHVSTGRRSLAEIAKSERQTPREVYLTSKAAPESPVNLEKLARWERRPETKRKGVVYYTKAQ